MSEKSKTENSDFWSFKWTTQTTNYNSKIQNSISKNVPVSKLRPEDVPLYCQETINRILNDDADTKIVTRSRSLKRIYSESSTSSESLTSEILNSPIPEDVIIDTKNLLEEVEKCRKRLGIPQTKFSEKILERAQGTYSDLKKRAKNWDEMKKGKGVFVRMYNWLKASDEEKLEMLEGGGETKKNSPSSPTPKRVRAKFTRQEKSELSKIFSESEHPSPAKKEEISKSMNLPLESVDNFFQNARRRMSRDN